MIRRAAWAALVSIVVAITIIPVDAFASAIRISHPEKAEAKVCFVILVPEYVLVENAPPDNEPFGREAGHDMWDFFIRHELAANSPEAGLNARHLRVIAGLRFPQWEGKIAGDWPVSYENFHNHSNIQCGREAGIFNMDACRELLVLTSVLSGRFNVSDANVGPLSSPAAGEPLLRVAGHFLHGFGGSHGLSDGFLSVFRLPVSQTSHFPSREPKPDGGERENTGEYRKPESIFSYLPANRNVLGFLLGCGVAGLLGLLNYLRLRQLKSRNISCSKQKKTGD